MRVAVAVLSNNDRAEVTAEYQREIGVERVGCGISKADLRAAVNAIDQWVDDNAAAFNSAIPQPARGTLTTREKARILLRVVERRFKVS